MVLQRNIYALAVYLVTIVLLKLKISIYRAIGTPGHGKYVSDGINVRDKGIRWGKSIGYQKKYYHNF